MAVIHRKRHASLARAVIRRVKMGLALPSRVAGDYQADANLTPDSTDWESARLSPDILEANRPHAKAGPRVLGDCGRSVSSVRAALMPPPAPTPSCSLVAI
eukprot:6214810-Pleurochrysis_carterae.AAC.9